MLLISLCDLFVICSDEDFGEEEGGEDGNYLTVNERGDASAFKKSPELS